MEIGEAINLGIDILMLPILVYVLIKKAPPRAGYLLAASLCIVMSHLATVVEGYILPGSFDLLEHLGLPAAGLLFLVGIAPILRSRRRKDGSP